jgi:hypothetical protein
MSIRKNYFLPFMRQGIVALADPGSEPGKRIVVPVKVNVQSVEKGGQPVQETVEKEIAILGPGDVLGIDRRVISKMAPAADTQNFEESLTPFIEFSEPDLLWRFSTRKAADNKNWLPWLSLILLKAAGDQEEGEFTFLRNHNPELPPRIRLEPHAVLPDLRESWRWAHVHLLELENTSSAQISNTIKQSPKKAVCRLLSPRRLEPETKYHAFLVPAYRTGLEAALGFSDGTEDRTLLSWDTPAEGAGKTLPYYHQWEFRTGTKGDFEYLVRILKPRVLENMGTRPIDVSNPGYGLQPEPTEMEMEGALKTLDTEYQDWGMDKEGPPNPTQIALAALLNKREETNLDGETILRVTPPVYGEWYAGKEEEAVKLNPNNKQHWVEELNLDFRHRAAAGLGVQFVKENQENLMKAAWEQFAKVKKVNRALNLGRFGRQVSLSMHKRLDVMNSDIFLRLSLPLQNKITSSQDATVNTVGAVIKNSPLVDSLGEISLKKFMVNKGFSHTTRTRSLLGNGITSFSAVFSAQVVNPGFRIQGLTNIHPEGGEGEQPDPGEPDPGFFAALGEQTKAALHPANTIENKLSRRFSSFRKMDKGPSSRERGLRSAAALDPLRPVMWYPEFHRPMYRFLRDISQEYILPGLENIPHNTIGLLQTNRRFIESFMIGLNHEFASELRWREFPTDMRGSYFRSFWDTSIYSLDNAEKLKFRTTEIGIALLQEITEKYGGAFDSFPKIEAAYTIAVPSKTEKEVADAYEAAVEKWLLTRDEDKDIDHPAGWRLDTSLGNHPVPGAWNDEEENQNQIVLLVRGELLQKFNNTLIYLAERSSSDPAKPDLTQTAVRIFPIFEGAFPPDTVFIGFPVKEADAGRYFVIFEERAQDLRFGLDIEANGTSENDFSWEHFTVSTGDYLDGLQPEIFPDNWNSAAYIAKVMVQKQVRVAVELEQLIPGDD